METSLRTKTAKVAAKWWAEAVCDPKFDNGDKSVTGMFTSSMAKASVDVITPEQKEKFERGLSGAINTELYRNRPIHLKVDYHPDLLLNKIAEESGVSERNFPWKTTMLVKLGYVAVVNGWGAERQILLETKEYYENEINETNRAIDRLQFKLSNQTLSEEDRCWHVETIEIYRRDLNKYKKVLDSLLQENMK